MVRISSRVSQTSEEEHATTAVKNIGASCQHVAVMPKWDVAPAFPSGLCASLPPASLLADRCCPAARIQP
jgi:hypothetical protein